MTLQPTREHPAPRRAETPHTAGEPAEGNGLLAQAAAYAKVARDAHRDCEKGRAAEQQLDKRRNRSGQ